MLIGYARVSTPAQNLDMQLSSLRDHGCDAVYDEVVSGGHDLDGRPVLQRVLGHLKPGDHLVVWRLDRLSRKFHDLMQIADDFRKVGIGLVSITEPFDLITPQGTMLFNILAAQAQFERQVISQRVIAGMEEARSQGKILGRPRKMTSIAELKVKELLDAGLSTRRIAFALKLSESTVKRAVRKLRQHNIETLSA